MVKPKSGRIWQHRLIMLMISPHVNQVLVYAFGQWQLWQKWYVGSVLTEVICWISGERSYMFDQWWQKWYVVSVVTEVICWISGDRSDMLVQWWQKWYVGSVVTANVSFLSYMSLAVFIQSFTLRHLCCLVLFAVSPASDKVMSHGHASWQSILTLSTSQSHHK